MAKNLKGKTFLVTGGAGFIGSHMTDALIERGGKVIIIDNFLNGKKENVNPKAVLYRANIADEKKIDQIFKKHKPDYIYHFAYFVVVPKSTENPLLDMDPLRGSINLLQASKKYGVKKFIFSSSAFIYGNNPHLPIKETEPHVPCSPYAITKFSIEEYLEFYRKSYGIDYIIFRNATVYGPRQIAGAMAAYIRELQSGKVSEFYGTGKTRDYIYIDDVVDIYLKALTFRAMHPDPIFNVGMGGEMPLIDLYHTLAKLLKKKPNVRQLPRRPGELERYSVDTQKARKAFGWKPKVGLEEGLRRTLSYWNLI